MELELQKSQKLISRIFYSTYIVFLFSGFASLIGSTLNGIIISRFFGADAIGAFGFAGPYVYFVEALAVGLSAGTQVVCGRYIGQGKPKEANQVLTGVAIVIAFVSVLIWFVFSVFPTGVAYALGATSEAGAMQINVIRYLQGCVIGLPAIIIMTVLCPLMQMDGDKIRALVAIVVMTAVSTLGNIFVPLVIYAANHNTAFSMFCLGLSSSIGYYVALLILLPHFFQKDRIFRFSSETLKISGLSDVISNGIPNMLHRGSLLLRSIVTNWVVFTFAGPVGMVAYSVTETFTSIPGRANTAYGQTSFALGGIVMGEGKSESLENLLKQAFKHALLGMGVRVLILLFFASFIAKIYLPENEEAAAITTVGIRLYGLSLIPGVLSQIMSNYYNCIGRLKLANLLNLFEGFIIVTACILLFVPLVGANGVWLGFFFGRFGTALFIVAYVWFVNRKFPMHIRDFLLLPEDFDCGADNRLEKIVESGEDVEEISLAAQAFCRKHNIDSKRSYYTALCIEEMANNIVNHGFTKDRKKHYLAVNVALRGDEISIRFQDDCKRFDPMERLKQIYENPDVTRNIGIRLITKIAKQMDYINTLKLNNLIIKV